MRAGPNCQNAYAGRCRCGGKCRKPAAPAHKPLPAWRAYEAGVQWCSRYAEHNGYVRWPCDPAERLPDKPEPKTRKRRAKRAKTCRTCSRIIPTAAEICRECYAAGRDA